MTNPTWINTAMSHLGLKEYPGAANNPTLMEWGKKMGAKILGIAYTSDSVPWCGLFVAHCMSENGILTPRIAIRASEWAKWGTPLINPTMGAVLVFSREGGGHVGFYVSEDAETYHVLGGNQGDAVSITKIKKDRCTAIRWSSQVPLPSTGRIIKKFDGKISENEA